jgi:hypothetical protein
VAISVALSTHLLEVCPDVLRGISSRIDGSLWLTFARVQEMLSIVSDLEHPRFSLVLQPKNSIENT